MSLRRSLVILACAVASACLLESAAQQPPPPASAARILLLPRRIVSGEHATLAILDVNGRLTPGVRVAFSNGDHLTTDVTGRALFVAPLNPGVIFGSIEGRSGRVATAILTSAEAAASSTEIETVPRVASLADRFEIFGKGLCGDADANRVAIGGHSALVLASSPVSLIILPPSELQPGDATVEISCAPRRAPPFSLTFVGLDLEADASPLKPGEHRVLTVRVQGSNAKISLEARNLAPDIADLAGGNPMRTSSSGGTENLAHFEIIGRRNGSFLLSMRLSPTLGRPR